MAKTEGDAKSRLQHAALELFVERGFDQTTAAEIAARAGVTERTFFRHFPDKREALFAGEAVLKSHLTAFIVSAPGRVAALDVLFEAFRSVVPVLEDNRSFSKPRHEVISSTPALQERELAKLEALSHAMAACLVQRGVPELKATLAASVGMSAFAHATLAWLDDPKMELLPRLNLLQQTLRDLLV